MNQMRPRPCFCTMCNRPHLLEMTNDEFRMMIGLSPNTLTDKGELIIACDVCVPFELSGRSA